MIFNQTTRKDLRDLFCNAVITVFGDVGTFLDFLEKGKYSTKYDCYVDYDEENYIINRETGEYINWYKLYHIGRCISISTLLPLLPIVIDFDIPDENGNKTQGLHFHYLYSGDPNKNIPMWIENFLVEFKESEDSKERE